MPTALITHPACLRHDAGPYHPECPDRLRAVLAALETPEFADLLRESAPHATTEQLTLIAVYHQHRHPNLGTDRIP